MSYPRIRVLYGPPILSLLLLVAACSGGTTPVEPLVGGSAVPVTLSTSYFPLGQAQPRLQWTGLPGAVEAVWKVEGPNCFLAHASAERAGSVIAIRVARAPNPLANCLAGNSGYRYLIRVTGLAAGRYDVRLIEDGPGQPGRAIGRSSVAVSPGS